MGLTSLKKTRERQAKTKSEYFDGDIFTMAGTNREHNQIAANLIRVLGNHLLEKLCSVYSKRGTCFSEITEMKEHKRVKDKFLWVPIDKRTGLFGLPMPPRKPETRNPRFWLDRDGDDLYFINDSEEILELVSAATGGFQTCDDTVVTVGSKDDYVYENVMPKEAVKIEEFHPLYDSDFVLQVDICVKSKNEGSLIIKSPAGKCGIKEAVLMWDTGEAGRLTSITRS